MAPFAGHGSTRVAVAGIFVADFACHIAPSPSMIRVLIIELIEVCYFVCSLYFRCASECCLHHVRGSLCSCHFVAIFLVFLFVSNIQFISCPRPRDTRPPTHVPTCSCWTIDSSGDCAPLLPMVFSCFHRCS